MLDILFLGKLFPKEKEIEIKNKMKSGMQDAANALQWNIIDGFDDNDCGTIKVVSQLPVNSYPRGYTERKIERYIFQHSKKYQSDDVVIKHTNITILKRFAIFSSLKKEIIPWAENYSERRKIIVLYTASLDFLHIARYIKNQYAHIETCCIIADLPEYSCARKLHGIHKIYNNYLAKKSIALYKFIDKYVLLTEQMAIKLNIRVPYMVMEGIAPSCDIELDESIVKKIGNCKYLLYSGTLNYEFGISVLLKAFALIQDENLKLIICGTGAAEKEIRNCIDKRIIFLGKVSRAQALSLQKHAAILINPRQNNEEFTKYSFPSKTMEYLAAGVPVVAYKLDGIPEEYDKYIVYVSNNAPESLAETILHVLSWSNETRIKFGKAGQSFVLKEKNNLKQTKRILEFIKTN